MPGQLLEQARGGDREAFTTLVEPYRRELQVHCYRMLGSLQDAEDMVQEALLAAWLGLDGFEGRSSVRTWLYRIATNRCLNALRAAGRRLPTGPPLPAPFPEPTRLGEVPWLQPYPDTLLAGLPDQAPGPEARLESREAISLAFITAVQLLPPSQRAVLLLRDVLGYRASEVAEQLGMTQEAVTSALKRARATMAEHHGKDAPGRREARMMSSPAPAVPGPGGPEERELLDRFVAAFTAMDIDALVALMTDDVWVRMPPLPFEYMGPAAARGFFTAIDARRLQVIRLVPFRANGQPAFGEYKRDHEAGALRCSGLIVVAVSGGGIREITRFEASLAPHCGLPETLD